VAFATRAPLRPTQQGVTVWFTGLPSAGKTTIANLVGDARGELRGLTGVDDPYEPPLAPELVLDTAGEPPEASAARVLELLERRPAPALVGSGQLPPPEFSRPEVAQLLADGYRTRRG
jgi:adenylylsulfate kinase-like enzyme